jgi:hypothetical protein
MKSKEPGQSHDKRAKLRGKATTKGAAILSFAERPSRHSQTGHEDDGFVMPVRRTGKLVLDRPRVTRLNAFAQRRLSACRACPQNAVRS